jgi:hypothetical protein
MGIALIFKIVHLCIELNSINMNTKNILIAVIFICFTQVAKAQFAELKGITIQATSKLYVEDNEAKSENLDQLFNVSFKDMILVHNIHADGVISVSQVYQLNSVKNTVDRLGKTIYKFNALSGLSGNTFKYEAKVDKEGKLESMVIEEPGGTKTTYKGGITELKTFKQ